MADMAWNTESPVSMDDDILHYLLFVYIWTRRISAALAAACCEYSDRENQSADDSDTRSPWPRHVRRGRDTCHTCLPTLTPAPRLGVNTLLWVAGDPSTLFFEDTWKWETQIQSTHLPFVSVFVTQCQWLREVDSRIAKFDAISTIIYTTKYNITAVSSLLAANFTLDTAASHRQHCQHWQWPR